MNNTATTSTNNQETTSPEVEPAITGDEKKEEGEETSSEEVENLKAENQRLQAQLSQQKILQSQADKKARAEKIERLKLERELKQIQAGNEPIIPEVGKEISTTFIEQKVLVKGLVAETILRNPEYQKVLETDPTLKDVLLTNPLAIVEEAYDAEDALNQIKEKLDSRVETLRASQKKVEQPKEGGAEFSAGPINVPEGTSPEIKTPSKKALEEGDIEKSILSKIKIT